MSIYAMSQAWKSAPVAGTELLMLLALADMANDDMECWPRIAHLAAKTRLSDRQVTRLISKMVKDRIIVRVTKSGRGRKGEESNLYRITPETWSNSDADVTTPGVMDVTTCSDADVTTPGVMDVTTMKRHQESLKEPPSSIADHPFSEKPYTEKPEAERKRKRKAKLTPEQEFRQRWNEYSAVGNALLSAFGADFVEPERQPRAALERYLEAAEQLQAAGCTPEDVLPLYRYIKRRASREEWPGSFGPAALARYYPAYLKSKELAAANDIVDGRPIIGILATREPIVPMVKAS